MKKEYPVPIKPKEVSIFKNIGKTHPDFLLQIVKETKLWDIKDRSRYYLFEKYFSLPDMVPVLARNGMVLTMSMLFEAPLLKAFFHRYEEEYKLMKEAGINDNKLRDILNLSLKEQEHTLLHALTDDNIPLVKFLLENNFDIEQPNVNKQTPLHIACANGNIKVVKRLIKAKANVDAIDITENTPLHFACYFCHLEIIDILIENKANGEATNKDHEQPLDLAHPKNAEEIELRLKIKKKTSPKEKSDGQLSFLNRVISWFTSSSSIINGKRKDYIPLSDSLV